MLPNLRYEKQLWKTFDCVIGVDEVGRGALAGPIVACAVLLKPKLVIRNKKPGIKDSKMLSELQREKIYGEILKNKSCMFALASASNKVIDKIGIGKANKLVMRKAVVKLTKNIVAMRQTQNDPPNISILIDGNQRLNTYHKEFPIVDGDAKVMSIALASIIAKVTRDRLMRRLHKKFQQYNWLENKGYGTKFHYTALRKDGTTNLHRKSFLAKLELI